MYLNKQNPVRVLLEQAARGHAVTSAELDNLEAVAKRHLPAGESFLNVRFDILTAARRAAALAEQGETGAARRVADDYCTRIGEKLSPAARALDTSVVEHEDADVIARRMFGH